MKKSANFLRLFWGVFFLAGACVNIYLTITDADSYKNGGSHAWPSFLLSFWTNTIATHMVLFLVLFIIIEIALGLLLLNKDKWAKLGLAGAVLFGLGLLMIGLGAERGNWAARVPNLVFEAMMIYCLFFKYDKTFRQTVRPKKELTRTSVIGS